MIEAPASARFGSSTAAGLGSSSGSLSALSKPCQHLLMAEGAAPPHQRSMQIDSDDMDSDTSMPRAAAAAAASPGVELSPLPAAAADSSSSVCAVAAPLSHPLRHAVHALPPSSPQLVHELAAISLTQMRFV